MKSETAGAMTMVSETPIEVSVISAGPDGAVIRWKRGATRTVDIDIPLLREHPEVKADMLKAIGEEPETMILAMNNVTMELAFNPELQYTGLRNLEEVKAATHRSLDALEKMRAERKLPPADPLTRKRLTDPKVIEQIMPREPLAYFGWLALSAPRGGAVELEVMVPSPLGGDPAPSAVKAELAAEPDALGRLVLRVTSKVDMEKYVQSLRKSLENTPGAVQLAPDPEKRLRDMAIGGTAEYHIEPTTGLATLAAHTTTTSIGGQTTSDELRWTVAPVPR